MSPTQMVNDGLRPQESLVSHLPIYIWSALLWTLRIILFGASPFIPKLQRFLTERTFNPERLRTLCSARQKFKYSVVFFCSSAGEYEQAKPLIDRFNKTGEFFIVTIFFSQSGADFAERRGEKTPFILSPIDNIWTWRRWFADFQPNLTIIIRHELWPAFIVAAREHAPVVIADAGMSQTANSLKSRIASTIKSNLMMRADRIFAVDIASCNNLKAMAGIHTSKIKLCGDTKYDRVAQRQLAQRKNVEHLAGLLNSSSVASKRLIVGSAWPLDIEIVLDALSLWLSDGGDKTNWQIVIVLHEPSPANIEAAKVQCKMRNLTPICFSELPRADSIECSAIIVDKMGILSELYGICDIAFVGGAMHHKVHNVLEPFCYNIPIAFGPLYHNSHEACSLIQAHHATSVQNSKELLTWWQRMAVRQSTDIDQSRRYLSEKLGASTRILQETLEIVPVFERLGLTAE
jgi:3-deoxy-D-manno-octulosonic-acid transferase